MRQKENTPPLSCWEFKMTTSKKTAPYIPLSSIWKNDLEGFGRVLIGQCDWPMRGFLFLASDWSIFKERISQNFLSIFWLVKTFLEPSRTFFQMDFRGIKGAVFLGEAKVFWCSTSLKKLTHINLKLKTLNLQLIILSLEVKT